MKALALAILLLLPAPALAAIVPSWIYFTLTPATSDQQNAGEEATGRFMLHDPEAEYFRTTSLKLYNTEWLGWFDDEEFATIAGQASSEFSLSAWDYSYRNFRAYFEADGTVRSPYFTEVCATTYALGTWRMEPVNQHAEIPEPMGWSLMLIGILGAFACGGSRFAYRLRPLTP